MKYFLLFFSLVLIPFGGYAQISFGGTPPSFLIPDTRGGTSDLGIFTVKVTPQESIEQLKKENTYAFKNMAPPIASLLINERIDLASTGTWQEFEGDSICRLKIDASGAEGIMLYYALFEIPHGGKLFIYNPSRTQILGAYTNQTKPHSLTQFATEFIYDESVVLEYVMPRGNNRPRIVISQVGYGIDLKQSGLSSSSLRHAAIRNISESCMVNVNCGPEGEAWQQQKKGVAKLIVPIGSRAYFCSGSLVNNTQQDHTPYFLSAYHCFYQNTESANFAQTLFYFHFESLECSDEVIATNMRTIVGADLLVNSPLSNGSDGTLLRLSSTIPAQWDVYYNGWDTSTTPPKRGVSIHHPQGDIKKISTYTNAASSSTFFDTSTYQYGASNAHWQVSYSRTANGHSVTEGGSSGAPLFNEEKRIVGTLTGGSSTCSSPQNPDYYGKFSSHWNITDGSYTMADYLNPRGIATITSINGISSLENASPLTGESFVTISPYVSNGYLFVQSSEAIKLVRVYNLAGQLITQASTPPINTTGWPTGVYIVSVETAKGKTNAKVLLHSN